MPALESIRAYFGTSTVVINATIATYILCTGIAPLFWAPFSERVGRRWVYISAMVLFIVCSIICSIAKSIGLFFVFRMLQGFFASAGQAVGGGSVADLFESKERGRAMSIYILGTILGPAFSPIIGGYVDQYLNWQWIFYIKAILGAVIAVLTFIFVQETLYVPSDGILSSTSSDPISWKQRLQNLKFNPFASLEFLLRPEVLLVCIPLSTSFGWFYFLVTILPETYSQIYHFSTGSIGLCYLAGGYRLTPLYLGIPFLVIGSLLYGWFLHFHLHWFTPLIGYCLTTFGIMFTITIGNTYLVESFITRSASVVSTNNFTRNIMATIFSLLAVNIRSGVGDGIA
ncbi:major facilitator superfamily domain-containing protein [Radiomyces spectabilis]|uniref:major facilitator superfamily domain-containing protein n=1 Tax=Radiomyces spectabilis TaxID=64574 RepID=UPI00221ED730|nr:major facilitator superfamily domain-containing protein [Radiomyces spectabilis]KAI8381176.1 major facilitator superfamily domain-containing protein [Radiomyces spectabilis]